MGQRFVAKIADVLGPEVIVERFFLMMTEQGLFQEDRLANPKIKRDQQLRLSLGEVSVVKVVFFWTSSDTWVEEDEAHPIYVISKFKFGDFWWMKRSGLLHN